MEYDDTDNPGVKSIDGSNAVVNSVILDYYKKFGRKRDLEQFFSLSTAESEVRDVTSLFWRRMKSLTDSSDSGEKKSESSTELCRISIKCSLPEPCSSQDENTKTKSDSESPPIITEEVPSRHTDDDSIGDDNQSQKSMDATLDTSANKPLSPTSSVTSQRKLEWDSLADVGYGNESDRKKSASSLSTLERLALKQQYSNNDSKEDHELGPPTAHSTPVDATENKCKGKKGGMKKTTKIYKKDVDIVEVSLPHGTERNPSQAINVNLTKHISFNMEKDGGISLDNITKDLNITPENIPLQSEILPHEKFDKEIQTTLPKTKEKSISPDASCRQTSDMYQRIPVLINLNTLKKKYRKRKLKGTRRKLRSKKKDTADKEYIPAQEKSTEQVSAAESFEYMPGHVYNQNQMNLEQPATGNVTGNKSSLESSGAITTESSKDSKHSFTKDLEKSIDLLKSALRRSHNDSELKNKLIKEVVQRLLKNKYRDDESTTDFLSGLSFSSKKLGLGESQTTTSTSDSNNTVSSKLVRPKKSILRLDKFNPNLLPSTSQSAPNLPSVSKSEKPIIPQFFQPTKPNTESDMSSGGKNSGMALGKTSSEELYHKYLEALKREEAYKKHLRDKEMFLKQKLVCSDTAFKVPQPNIEVNNKLKDLIKDLTRNNYDDGSGDASKLEGGSNSNVDVQRYKNIRKQRSHSVFTLSSGNSDDQNRKANMKKKMQNEIKETQAGHSRDNHHCCCPHRYTVPKVDLADSSVQVNLKNVSNESSADRQTQLAKLPGSSEGTKNSPRNIAHVLADDLTGEIQYVCLCNNKPVSKEPIPDNMLIYKCSRLTTSGAKLDSAASKTSNTVGVQCMADNQQLTAEGQNMPYDYNGKKYIQSSSSSENLREMDRMSKSSQTDLAMKILQRKCSERSFASLSSVEKKTSPRSVNSVERNKNIVHEATRSVQTDISINPRISDPSLADINIVNEGDCVKLISERFREASKRSSETDIKYPTTKDHNKVNTTSEYSPRILRSSNIRSEEVIQNKFPDTPMSCPKEDKEVQSYAEPNNNIIQPEILDQPEKNNSENFTIPILGTNMTLMVRIGSKGNKIAEEKVNDRFSTQCVGTEKIEINEKATCLSDECSKGVQSQTTDIFAAIDNNNIMQSPRQIGEEPSIGSQTNDHLTAFNRDHLVNTCTGGTSVRNTYPRKVPINPKPFLRSNTDTGRFVTGAYVQTENVAKNDAVTQQDPPKPDNDVSKKPRQTDTDIKISQCPSEKSFKSRDDSQKSGDTDLDVKVKYDSEKSDKTESNQERTDYSSEARSRKSSSEGDKDAILDIIKDITKRYSKKDIDRSKKKKCFKEIVTVLNYLLDTDDGTDNKPVKLTKSSTTRDSSDAKTKKKEVLEKPLYSQLPENRSTKVDKGVQLTPRKSKASKHSTESSEIPATTEFPGTSSDSATCKVLSKIKKECEKYHQRRCKSHGMKKCEASSSTSVNCDQCKRVHHCPCRGHRCQKSKSSADKQKKKCVAYNLIIQTSDSMISEETITENGSKPLQNIVVKVPSRRKHMEKMPFNEVSAKIEKNLPRCSPRADVKTHRSRSCPNDSEISSIDEYAKKNCGYSVRDYLEQNRPDFLEKTSNRQQCLKIISEKRTEDVSASPNLKMVVVHNPCCMRSMETCNTYCGGMPMNCNYVDPFMQCMQSEVTRIADVPKDDARVCMKPGFHPPKMCATSLERATERSTHRQLLSVQLDMQPTVTDLSETELLRLARDLGVELRRKKLAPKFISEREMKKHSEMIYKSLPEVVQKKEEIKKDNVKKTNLLMANIFKKNLQKKTLRGAVNLSNYNTVIKI